MSVIAAAVKHMLAAGMSADAIVAAIEEMERNLPAPETARQARNRRYYAKKASENVLNRLNQDDSDAPVFPETKTSPTPPKKTQPLSLPPSPLSGAHGSPPTEFDAFWDIWPEKKGKGSAERAFAKARHFATLEQIVAGVPNVTQTHAWRSGHHVHASTWLNDKRWLDVPDDYERTMEPTPGMVAAAQEELGFRRAMERFNGSGGNRVGNPGVILPLPAPSPDRGRIRPLDN